MCTYKWAKPNAEEIQARIAEQRQEAIARMMKQARRGKRAQGILDGVMNMPSTENVVSYNLAPFTFRSPEEANTAYSTNIERLNKGISRPVKTKNVNEQVTFRMEQTPVDGVADGAHWFERMNQLSVLDGTRIFYVVTNLEEERSDNLAHAKRLAERLAAD